MAGHASNWFKHSGGSATKSVKGRIFVSNAAIAAKGLTKTFVRDYERRYGYVPQALDRDATVVGGQAADLGEGRWARNRALVYRRVPALAVFGDKLQVDDPSDPLTIRELEAAAKLPRDVLEEIAGLGYRVKVSSRSVNQQLDTDRLDNAAGVYSNVDRAIVASAISYMNGTTLSHELAHALAYINDYEQDPQLRDFHRKLYDKLTPYQQTDGPGSKYGSGEILAYAVQYHMGDESQGRDLFGDEFMDYVRDTYLARKKIPLPQEAVELGRSLLSQSEIAWARNRAESIVDSDEAGFTAAMASLTSELNDRRRSLMWAVANRPILENGEGERALNATATGYAVTEKMIAMVEVVKAERAAKAAADAAVQAAKQAQQAQIDRMRRTLRLNSDDNEYIESTLRYYDVAGIKTRIKTNAEDIRGAQKDYPDEVPFFKRQKKILELALLLRQQLFDERGW